MSAFLAIVGDTWRQSKHQWVMPLVLVLMVAGVALSVLFVGVRELPDGTKVLSAETDRELVLYGLEREWDGLYASALRHQLGLDDKLAAGRKDVDALFRQWQDADYRHKQLISRGAPEEEIRQAGDLQREMMQKMELARDNNRELSNYIRNEVDKLIEQRTGHVSKLDKGAEWQMASIAQMIYSLAMLGFIAICAGYIPNMLESGSIDLVLSKPIRRWHIYFGKYVGGLLLFSAALLGMYVATFVLFGLMHGIWLWQFFGALPMTLFSLALLYAIVGWVGLWTRSTGMAMVVGYVYYVVVDTAVGVLTDPVKYPWVSEISWIESWVEIVKMSFPSFHWLKKSAEGAVFSVVVMPWTQIGVGFAWLVLSLFTGYNRFRINDY
ncbi:MAG: ABC transporter permease [Planctomycetes bacterium]|nr:ABC transporter permease [Planctomycetota bacterium]